VTVFDRPAQLAREDEVRAPNPERSGRFGRPNRVRAGLREPLHRTGNALIFNSVVTAFLGVAFWAAAARGYGRDDVGLNSTAISTMMMLSGLSQLNLMSAMVRFLPTAGRDALRLVGAGYAMSAALSVVVATVFVIGARGWLPVLADFFASWPVAVWFIASTALWCIFVLQDSILTGLGRPTWVPLENTLHSVSKLALVVLLATACPRQGIFLSWTLAVVVASVPVNLILFVRMLPRHARQARVGDGLPSLGQLVRFVFGDYAAAACWIGVITVPAQLVLKIEGPAAAAEFSVAWAIGYALYSLPAAVGQGLVVQGAQEPDRLDHLRRMAFRHTFRVLVPITSVTVLTAPVVLRLFGGTYAAGSSAELRLLALSSIPNAVVALTVSELRVHRRVLAVWWLMFATLVLVLGISYVLLQPLGIRAVGVAWLTSQLVVAALAVIFRRRVRAGTSGAGRDLGLGPLRQRDRRGRGGLDRGRPAGGPSPAPAERGRHQESTEGLETT
jgi:O-antigen/teichoic acid export membrane protein